MPDCQGAIENGSSFADIVEVFLNAEFAEHAEDSKGK